MERATSAEELASLEARMMWNLAGCMLARVDGTSPAPYLIDPAMKAAAFGIAR